MDKDIENIAISPAGAVSIDELAQDIAQRTNGQPAPAKRPRKAKNAFPLEALPPKLEELVRGAETALGAPPDFLAASCLLAAAIAAGNTYQLEIKRAVTQRAIFYLVLVGNPNSNKSGPLKFALSPITKRDGENYDEYQAQRDAYETEQAKPKKEREEVERPIFCRSLVSDITMEALASVHQDNPRGIGAIRDEIAGFVKDFNRYSQGGDAENYLSMWNGDALTVDRKTSGPIRIKKTFVCVGGTIQPAVIEELANGGRAANGFIDRLLFVWPDGLEKPLWTDDEINLPLLEAYQDAITRLLDLTFDAENKAHTLTLEADAKRRLFQFFNDENKPLCDAAENEALAGIYGKFDIHTARLVIALHLLWWAYQGKGDVPHLVECQTVERAIRAAEYFRSQALKVFNRLHNSSPIDKLPADKLKVYEALPGMPETFKTADGQAIAERLGMPARTFRHWLTSGKGELFESPRFGEWAKLY